MSTRLLLDIEQVADLQGVRAMRHALEKALRATRLSVSSQNKALLAFSEAATNVVEHGQTATALRCRLKSQDATWTLAVLDNGEVWAQGEAFLAAAELSAVDAWGESGRGLGLLQTLVPEVRYQAHIEPGWHSVSLVLGAAEIQTKPRLWLVEDDTAIRTVLVAYLQADYEVEAFSAAQDALNKARREVPDLVVSDIRMPGMDGLAFRQQLNELGHDLLPFVFLTGHDADELQTQAAVLGIDDFLTKPVSKRQLLNTIERVLQRRASLEQRMLQRLDKSITSGLKSPQLPESEHWELALGQRMSRLGGGDFVLTDTRDGQTLLILADVMGHDEGARFFAHAMAGYVRGWLQANPGWVEPHQILAGVSSALHHDELLSRSLLTCVVLSLEAQGRVRMASGGHPAPWLLAHGQHSEVAVSGVLPGLMATTDYVTHDCLLAPGQRLCVFSDGLFEAAASTEARQSLYQVMTQALEKSSTLPLSLGIETCLNQFDRSAGHPPADDATLILIQTKDR